MTQSQIDKLETLAQSRLDCFQQHKFTVSTEGTLQLISLDNNEEIELLLAGIGVTPFEKCRVDFVYTALLDIATCGETATGQIDSYLIDHDALILWLNEDPGNRSKWINPHLSKGFWEAIREGYLDEYRDVFLKVKQYLEREAAIAQLEEQALEKLEEEQEAARIVSLLSEITELIIQTDNPNIVFSFRPNLTGEVVDAGTSETQFAFNSFEDAVQKFKEFM
jgi:hypothetical protein